MKTALITFFLNIFYLIPGNGTLEHLNVNQYEPTDAKIIMGIYEEVFKHEFERFKHLKFVYTDRETVYRYCGEATVACTFSFYRQIIMNEEYKNDCYVVAHELLHNVIFELGAVRGVEHHNNLFDLIVLAVCDKPIEYAKQKK